MDDFSAREKKLERERQARIAAKKREQEQEAAAAQRYAEQQLQQREALAKRRAVLCDYCLFHIPRSKLKRVT